MRIYSTRGKRCLDDIHLDVYYINVINSIILHATNTHTYTHPHTFFQVLRANTVRISFGMCLMLCVIQFLKKKKTKILQEEFVNSCKKPALYRLRVRSFWDARVFLVRQTLFFFFPQFKMNDQDRPTLKACRAPKMNAYALLVHINVL